MHLKSIRIRGFKSFPDPVEVRLEPGVAVVVGPNGSGLGHCRWVVERTFAWLHNFKRLLVRYERRADIHRADIHRALLGLACCLVCFRRLRNLAVG